MSSRIAVCGQQPVCTASIRSSGEDGVAAQEVGVLGRVDVVGDDGEVVARRPSVRQSAAASAVLPEPTGPPSPTRSGPCRARDAGGCGRVDVVVQVVIRRQRTCPSVRRGPRRGGRGAGRWPAGQVVRSRRPRGDGVDLGREPRGDGGDGERVEGEQPLRGRRRAADRQVGGGRRRRPAASSPPAAAATPSAIGWCGRSGSPSHAGDGQARRPTRTRPRPCCRDAARSAGDGVRASASASSAASVGSVGPHAAAARPAATAPAVASRRRRNAASEPASRTCPAAIACSTPPECAWPPAGSRESASVSRAAVIVDSEQEVALGHGQLAHRLGLPHLAVDATR